MGESDDLVSGALVWVRAPQGDGYLAGTIRELCDGGKNAKVLVFLIRSRNI